MSFVKPKINIYWFNLYPYIELAKPNQVASISKLNQNATVGHVTKATQVR